MADMRQMLIITIVGTILAGLIMSGAGLVFIGGDEARLGSTDHTITITSKGHELSTITSHIELNDNKFAIGWKPEQGDVKSETMVVDLSRMTFDRTNGMMPVWWLHYWVNSISRVWYEYYIDGGKFFTTPYYEIPIIPTHSPNSIINQGIGLSYINDEMVIVYESEIPRPPSFNLLGTDIGILTVKMKADINYAWSGVTDGDEGVLPDVTMAEFDAELKSGEGYVRIGGNMPDVIEVGSNVEFFLKTGFTHGQGWTCYIVDPQGNKHEFLENGFTGQDGFDGYVDFTIPFDWFELGGDNECMIELYNHLWKESITTFFVIDDIDLAPEKPTINVQTNYNAGSTVQVTVHSNPNPTTNASISHFRVYAYYGVAGSMPSQDFPSEWLILGEDYPADAGGSAQFSFALVSNRHGVTFSIKVNAIDEDGRASFGQFYSADLKDEEGGGGGDIDPAPEYPFIIDMMVIVLIAIGIALAVLIFLFAPIPDIIRIALAMITAIAFLIVAVLQGTGGGLF